MKLSYKKFDLPLRHVFTISRGSVSVQETLVVQIESQHVLRVEQWRGKGLTGDQGDVLPRGEFDALAGNLTDADLRAA